MYCIFPEYKKVQYTHIEVSYHFLTSYVNPWYISFIILRSHFIIIFFISKLSPYLQKKYIPYSNEPPSFCIDLKKYIRWMIEHDETVKTLYYSFYFSTVYFFISFLLRKEKFFQSFL